MSLIRYQSPELMAWPSLDRWSNLRDDLNSLFELPLWSSIARQGQLFSGWSPALDLYQNNRRGDRTARNAQGRHRNFPA